MLKLTAMLAFASACAGLAYAASPHDALPGKEMLPEGTIQVSPVIPGMGEHWMNVENAPLGPIYCVHEDKIVCLEFMISQEDLAAGKSWPDLAGMEGLPPVDHVNIGFEPQGHEGYEVSHYDIHMYFLPPEDIAAIK